MYPNVLLSVFVGLIALKVIGEVLHNDKLAKAAGVLIVGTVAAALILWLLKGLSPVPQWATRALLQLAEAGQRLVHR